MPVTNAAALYWSGEVLGLLGGAPWENPPPWQTLGGSWGAWGDWGGLLVLGGGSWGELLGILRELLGRRRELLGTPRELSGSPRELLGNHLLLSGRPR